MAIRARIKSKIKSLLFGSSTSTKSTVATPSSTQQPAFESPVVSTQATQTTTPKTDAKSTPITKVDSASDDSGSRSSKDVPEDASAQENQGLTEDDTTEATFIVEVTELFPVTCPHCDTSTDNNWIRIENKFACGSCGTAY